MWLFSARRYPERDVVSPPGANPVFEDNEDIKEDSLGTIDDLEADGVNAGY
jgi:hypothetical protein